MRLAVVLVIYHQNENLIIHIVKLNILEIKDKEVHIVITGVAITDGYTDPYKTANFTIDCWLSIPK